MGLYRRFRDFFSKMERGRILLLGIIACVMLFERTFGWSASIWYLPEDYRIHMLVQISPVLLAYTTGFVLVLYVIVSVRWKMRRDGENMTLEHLRELAFIALALALLAIPWAIIDFSYTIETIIDLKSWEPDTVLTERLIRSADAAIGLLAYAMIAFLSWRAYKRRTVQADHRLKRGRVLTLTLIALVMQSSNIIHSFGWIRYHQIYQWSRETGWGYWFQSPFWFYYYCFLACVFLGWFIITWYRMRNEDTSMSHGQLQELTVISLGLLLLAVPSYLNVLRDYIEQYILSDPPDWGEAYETVWFYIRFSLLFSIFAYLIIGLLAMRRYRRTMPIDVVPLEEPALPPPTNAPDDRSLNKD